MSDQKQIKINRKELAKKGGKSISAGSQEIDTRTPSGKKLAN